MKSLLSNFTLIVSVLCITSGAILLASAFAENGSNRDYPVNSTVWTQEH